jgi:hypothetical protein
MERLSRLTLAFALLFAAFIVTPAFLGMPFPPYPLLSCGDVLDLVTPLVLIPLYWALFRVGGDPPPGRGETIAFLALAALWVEGQGMHLAANAIGHLVGPRDGADLARLTHAFDEQLSHYLWHGGMVGLSALLIHRQWRHPFAGKHSGLGLESVAGVIHGFNYFITIVEAGTAPLGIPFAASVLLFVSLWGRRRLRQQPLLAFFLVAYLVATACFLGWGLYWRGLPQFSEVGIIR